MNFPHGHSFHSHEAVPMKITIWDHIKCMAGGLSLPHERNARIISAEGFAWIKIGFNTPG